MVRDILVKLLNESVTMEKMISILQSMLTENTVCITIDSPLIESILCRQPVPKDLPQANDTPRRSLIITPQGSPRRFRTITEPMKISLLHTEITIHNSFPKLIPISNLLPTINENIINDLSLRNKTRLRHIYNVTHHLLKPGSKDFCNNLVNN